MCVLERHAPAQTFAAPVMVGQSPGLVEAKLHQGSTPICRARAALPSRHVDTGPGGNHQEPHHTQEATCPKGVLAVGVGEEVVALDGPVPAVGVLGGHILGRGRIEQVDAAVQVDVMHQLVHVLVPAVGMAVVEVGAHGHDDVVPDRHIGQLHHVIHKGVHPARACVCEGTTARPRARARLLAIPRMRHAPALPGLRQAIPLSPVLDVVASQARVVSHGLRAPLVPKAPRRTVLPCEDGPVMRRCVADARHHM